MKVAELSEVVSDFVPRTSLAQEGLPRTIGFMAAGQTARLMQLKLKRGGKLQAGLGSVFGLAGRFLTGLGIFSSFFYRDPERDPLANDINFFYAPADGKIIEIAKEVYEPKYIGALAHKITIASHLLDVHIQRAPVPGVVRYVFCDNSQPQAPANYLGIALLGDDSKGRILLVQQNNPKSIFRLPAPLADKVPGSLRVWAGNRVELAQKIGLAGFGQPSLVSLYLPAQIPLDILCQEGQQVQAGMTVLGRLKLI